MLERNRSNSAGGAYGLRLLGLYSEPTLSSALITPPDHWPAVRVEWREGRDESSGPEFTVHDDSATIRLGYGGQVKLDRSRRRATIVTPQPLGHDQLIHPALAYIGSVFSHWLGRPALHAGVFVAEGGAWALLGMRHAGKSSTLAWLARAGYPILTDDMLVLDGWTALAGPRAIDVTASSARYLGADADADVVRAGRRQRIMVEGIEAECPFRGWIALAWGARVEAVRVPLDERLALLARHLHSHPPVNPRTLLEVASAPVFELRRPKRLTSLPDVGRALLELTTS
jgi:hypothetical protein